MKEQWRTGQRVDPRGLFLSTGCDFKCDARVLVVRNGERLVWARPCCGRDGRPSSRLHSLEVRSFRFEAESRPVFHCTVQISAGGWLSKERLLLHRPTIDALFGEGVSDSLDPRTTTIVGGADPVFDYLMAHRCRSVRTLRSPHLRVEYTASDMRPVSDRTGWDATLFCPSWLPSGPKVRSR